MAYLKTGPMLRRIREVVEDSAGTLRQVPSARFLGEMPEGLDPESAMAKAIDRPRIEAMITSITPSDSTPPTLSNLRLYDVEVKVKIVRVVTPLEQVSDADRDALMGLAAQDADVVAQALGFPGNLTTTTAGTSTDIVSGLLLHRATSVLVRKAIDDGAQPIETSHTYLARMISRPVVYVSEPRLVTNGTSQVTNGSDDVSNGSYFA